MSERVEMDPVILSCAVRYALGRHSYLPGLVADEVRRTWPEDPDGKDDRPGARVPVDMEGDEQMTNDPVDGGTVTYHRAEWRPENEMWEVWFPGHDRARWSRWFTAEEGAAMGLTVPEPEPLAPGDVIANVQLGSIYHAEGSFVNRVGHYHADRILIALDDAGYDVVLRDARQDPQPTADTPDTADAPSDDIDFDALPIGTVLRHRATGDIVEKRTWWWNVTQRFAAHPTTPEVWEVFYQPPTPSPRQHLEALLAGRDEADMMLAHPRTWAAEWMNVICGAARGGA